MHIRPIRTDEDHETALREIEALWGAEDGTEAGDRLDVLATLVETYESRRWPIEPLDPVRAIEAAMEMNGYTRAELAALIGQSRASSCAHPADDPQDRRSVARPRKNTRAGLCTRESIGVDADHDTLS